MQGPILRKYGVATTIDFELFEVDGIDFRVDAVHASGDTAIMKDEGAEANTSNAFVDEGNGYSLALTATEMQAARIVIYVVDQTATKVWLDSAILIETYGDASAEHAVDLDDSVRAGLTALPNAAAEAAGGLYTRGTGAGQINQDANGRVDSNIASVSADAAAIQSDTDDIQGQLPAALTTGTADSGSTTTMVDAALTEADTDYWAGSWIRFTSGNISGQTRLITGFTPASDTITFAPATTQAVATHNYEILPAGGVDVQEWLRTAVTISATSTKPEIDVFSVSDDSAAANNLESACDNYSATRGLAGTALPAAAAEAAGGLYTRGAGAGQINQDANGRVDANIAAVSADGAAADNLEADYDGTGYTKANSTVGTVTALTGHTL